MITNNQESRGSGAAPGAPNPKACGVSRGPATERRKLIITVDTEALPLRSSSRHVERLIWGRFGDREFGLNRLMAIADRYATPLTFFVDLCEVPLYPGAFESVCQTIQARGH